MNARLKSNSKPIPSPILDPALTVNMTHLVVVGKALPNSPIPEQMKKLGVEHKQFVSRAGEDSTKTETTKSLMVRQDANNRINKLLPEIDKSYQVAFGQITELENIVSEQWGNQRHYRFSNSPESGRRIAENKVYRSCWFGSVW